MSVHRPDPVFGDAEESVGVCGRCASAVLRVASGWSCTCGNTSIPYGLLDSAARTIRAGVRRRA